MPDCPFHPAIVFRDGQEIAKGQYTSEVLPGLGNIFVSHSGEIEGTPMNGVMLRLLDASEQIGPFRLTYCPKGHYHLDVES